MEPAVALLAGLGLGLAIAVQFGAVSLLLVETAAVDGPWAGVAAGVGVATADLTFAGLAAAGGGTVGSVLGAHEGTIRSVAAALLAAIAIRGLIGLAREGPARHRLASCGVARGARRSANYGRFLAITLVNPLTIVSFAAGAAAISLDGPAAAVTFATGVGAASAAWHVALALLAGHAGRRLTPRARRWLAIAGRLAVLAIAGHLALRA